MQNIKKALADSSVRFSSIPASRRPLQVCPYVYTWEGWESIERSLFLQSSPRPKPRRLPRKPCSWTRRSPSLLSAGVRVGRIFLIGLGPRASFAWLSRSTPTTRMRTISTVSMLAQLGRLDQALAENMRAAELDPLSPENLFVLGIHACLARQLPSGDGAVPVKLWTSIPVHSRSLGVSAGCEIYRQDSSAKRYPNCRKPTRLNPTGSAAGYLGYAYAASSGDRTRAMAVLEELSQQSSRGFVSPFWPAIIYLALGDWQRAGRIGESL